MSHTEKEGVLECVVDLCSQSVIAVNLIEERYSPLVVNSLSSTTSIKSLLPGASSPSTPCACSAFDRWVGSASSETPPSLSSISTAAVRSARLASSSSCSSQASIRAGGPRPGLLPVLQDHNSSPAQWKVSTACPFIPCVLPSELTSITHVPTAIGTVGASRLAMATMAPLVAFLGNGGPRCRPGVMRSAPPWSFSTT